MSSGCNTDDGCIVDAVKESTYNSLISTVNLLQRLSVIEPAADHPVVEFYHPAALQEKIDLSLNEQGENDQKLFKLCEDVARYSVHTNHPHFHNQLYGGVDPYGLVGAIITEVLNTNQYTFEVAPVFTLCEHIIIQKTLQKIGLEEGDGIFVPGGSISNMYGMALARYKVEPKVKKQGLACLQSPVIFTSEDSHYSVQKGAHWLGIGTDNTISVKTDERGKMIPEELEKMILQTLEQGKRPFFVNATAGSTVLGAFDPLPKIADICEKYKIWLHVDACWGGSLMFSKKHSKVLEGLHRADSVAWNAHKMLGAPLQCSLFITKHKVRIWSGIHLKLRKNSNLLHESNSASASYLFQQDKFYDVSYDTGDKSIQCGRKVDAFKLWLMWKARGDSGFEKLVDHAMACSRYFKDQISNRKGFELVLSETECTNVCFWYIPKRLRDLTKNEKWWEELGQVAPKLREKLTNAGTLLIGYQPIPHKNLKNFFRLIITCHPERTFDDMDHIINQIELHGEGL